MTTRKCCSPSPNDRICTLDENHGGSVHIASSGHPAREVERWAKK